MSQASLGQYTAKVRELVQSTPERVFIRARHIEKDRIWREILESDVRRVLENGKVERVRSEDLTVLWRGRDVDGRLLELQCALVNEDGNDTMIVRDAFLVRVGTAYEPGKDDGKLKKEWLKSHPDYEDAPGGGVRRKVSVSVTRRKDR